MHQAALVAALAVCAAFVADCENAGAKKASSQVLARVNSEEITIHELNYALRAAPEAAQGDRAQVESRRATLQRLINADLARQQAVENKLDRSPQVQQALQAARTEILATAYLQQVAASQPKPTREEVAKFHDEHKELFSQRRLYMLDEMTFPSRTELAAPLSAAVAKARSLDDVAQWLKSQNVPFARGALGRAAEDIPLDILPKLQAMKVGDIGAFEVGGQALVLQVAAAQPAPMDPATATTRIEQFLMRQRAAQAVDAELARLKGRAKIEYVDNLGRALRGPEEKGGEEKQGGSSGNVTRAVEALRSPL